MFRMYRMSRTTVTLKKGEMFSLVSLSGEHLVARKAQRENKKKSFFITSLVIQNARLTFISLQPSQEIVD
jgi:hypothetical protein